MGFRPLTSEEIQECEDKIKQARAEIMIKESWISVLELEMKQGVWELDASVLKKIVEEVKA